VLFGIVVLYLRCRHSSSSYSHTGFRRLEPLLDDEEDGSPFISRANGHKVSRNTHAMPSESDDDDETLFSSNVKKPLIS
jgi:hypothetical protein